MSGALLEVGGLTKRFGGLVAVKDIGFAIEAGEILGLIGPNGSGKSTVMKLIMGIIRPNAGTVRLAGENVAGWPSHRIARRGIGIVFQHSRPLHRQTVLENIKLALLPDSLIRLFADPEVDSRARGLIGSSADLAELERVLLADGRTLWDRGLARVADGTTSLDALRAAVRYPR